MSIELHIFPTWKHARDAGWRLDVRHPVNPEKHAWVPSTGMERIKGLMVGDIIAHGPAGEYGGHGVGDAIDAARIQQRNGGEVRYE